MLLLLRQRPLLTLADIRLADFAEGREVGAHTITGLYTSVWLVTHRRDVAPAGLWNPLDFNQRVTDSLVLDVALIISSV